MGQAWCKEKTSKAQDSKSPLDRVFVRCAHRIYPSLKEEGSVLGGATQRVTSSEIGYAGSPPREVLTRGRSIDSVDRPFHPSDWVDVNLEVPSTPRASSVLTNLTVDTNLYPGTTPTSSCSNLKDATPVPPPRRRKRNKGRPLPPKPDEIPENPTGSNSARVDVAEEPLYSSVKSPKTSGDEQDRDEESRTEKSCSNEREEPRQEGRRTREIYEHKVNGTGRIIPREVVSGKRAYHPEERRTERSCDSGNSDRRIQEDEEYERFARNQSVKDSSTPYREQNGRRPELENRIKDPSQDSGTTGSGARTKNYSTVSLPNYDELDVARHSAVRTKPEGGVEERARSRRPVRSSTGSLPAESFLSPFSEKTSVRFEDYIPRRGSTENLPPYQVLGKLDCAENGVSEAGFVKYDPSKLEDWNLTDIGNCESNHHRRLSFEGLSGIGDEKHRSEGDDVVDFSPSIGSGESEGKDRQEISGSPIVLQKPSGFGMTAASEEEEDSGLGRNKEERKTCEPMDNLNGPHARFYGPPTLENCKLSGACSPSAACAEPFFLDEEKHRAVLDTIGESCRNGAISLESDRGPRSRMIFGRSLSNESEPYEDACESKELSAGPSPSATGNLIRTISEESLPREMLEEVDRELDDFFDEKLAKDVHNKLKKDCAEQRLAAKTPPPSPEPRITAEILDNDHSALLKILKEEAAEESNLSSMTPSLTELEAALSDMLEKEDPQEEARLQQRTEEQRFPRSPDRLIEPDIVPVEKNPGFREDPVTPGSAGKTLVDGTSVPEAGTLEQLHPEERKPPVAKTRKVSFCAWEDVRTPELDAPADDSKDCPPEKPSRLQKSMEDSAERPEHVPTPPRRRNKGASVGRKDSSGESCPNDRLI